MENFLPASHPLALLSVESPEVTEKVVDRMVNTLPDSMEKLEELISESLFQEKKRLQTTHDPVRDAVDLAFWTNIRNSFQKPHRTKDHYKEIINSILRYHLNEIEGHFNENTYRLSTQIVPRGFLWLLNALSIKSFFSLRPDISLRNKVVIQGQLDQLRYLSNRGTIILVPTHFSNLDSLLMGWALFDQGLPPFCYGAGLNLFSNPVLGFFMNNLGAYKVDRRKKHGLYLETLKEYSTNIIERKCHSLFFPGGGRSRSGALEEKLKMGLLGTGLQAYIRNLKNGHANPNIYFVPCVISYNFVLEASNLVSDYLSEQGQTRFLDLDDAPASLNGMAKFTLKFFGTTSKIVVNFGRALDPFGHLVDDTGQSITDQGRRIDCSHFVKSSGEVCSLKQRDEEYTKILASRIVERFRAENVVLSSHFLAFVYFNVLRKKFSHLDLYHFLKISEEDTYVSKEEFFEFGQITLKKIQDLFANNRLILAPVLKSSDLENILESGLKTLGVYHQKLPVQMRKLNGKLHLVSEDLKLLYYYSNRMIGYDL